MRPAGMARSLGAGLGAGGPRGSRAAASPRPSRPGRVRAGRLHRLARSLASGAQRSCAPRLSALRCLPGCPVVGSRARFPVLGSRCPELFGALSDGYNST